MVTVILSRRAVSLPVTMAEQQLVWASPLALPSKVLLEARRGLVLGLLMMTLFQDLHFIVTRTDFMVGMKVKLAPVDTVQPLQPPQRQLLGVYSLHKAVDLAAPTGK